MAPIRIALIGLSASAKTGWAAAGHLPYLRSARGKDRYKIVALLNSSVSAAEHAIKHFELDQDVKAYGSPTDLAADADVDLAVCTTRVDVHLDAIMPCVEAGKSVFVEWPLAENASRAQALKDAAVKSGSTTLVGLQGRVMPVIVKLKELVRSGVIGKVVSSDVTASTPGGGGWEMSEGLAYFLDKKVGGNPVTIGLGHTIDYVHTVLSEYEAFNAQSQIQRPNQTIIDKKTGGKRPMTSDVPDLVSVHGKLKAASHVADGALLTVNYRSGPPFPGTTPLVWTMTGEKGRIRVSNERGPYLQAIAAALPTPIELETFASGEVKQIDWEWEDWQQDLAPNARGIAKLYDLLYEGRTAEWGMADFASAVERHKEIDSVVQ